jgi:hypothetical protein
MMRRALRVAELLVVPTIALAVAVGLAPNRATFEVHLWLLAVLVLALLAFMRVVAATYARRPSPFEASLVPASTPAERPPGLTRLEREVSMARSSAFDLHARLRPTVVELAAELLSGRRGIDLERDPARARAVLGDDAWELVRPDRPAPADRHAPGIPDDDLLRIVTALEHV